MVSLLHCQWIISIESVSGNDSKRKIVKNLHKKIIIRLDKINNWIKWLYSAEFDRKKIIFIEQVRFINL